MFTGWSGVALCALAATLSAAMLRRRLGPRTALPLLVASLAVSVALVAASALLLLDLIGAIFFMTGDFHARGAASRAACLGTAALLALATRSFRRRAGIELPVGAIVGEPKTEPGLYAKIAACLTRIGAQAVVGFVTPPQYAGIGAILFQLCFVLAGTLLPMALVHDWGRIWPRWVIGLAGRRVPRWAVLGPGIAIGALTVVYFGIILAQMVFERLHGRNPFPPDGDMTLPESFFWVAVPAYVTWGVALAVAALSYHRRTSPREGQGSLAGGMDRTPTVTRLGS